VLTVRDSNSGGMLKTTVSKTAADESTGGVTLLTRPPPSCQDSLFSTWATLRMLSGENEAWKKVRLGAPGLGG
jgi:hypothetical protein